MYYIKCTTEQNGDLVSLAGSTLHAHFAPTTAEIIRPGMQPPIWSPHVPCTDEFDSRKWRIVWAGPHLVCFWSWLLSVGDASHVHVTLGIISGHLRLPQQILTQDEHFTCGCFDKRKKQEKVISLPKWAWCNVKLSKRTATFALQNGVFRQLQIHQQYWQK
jgi:hypothetical protein